MNKLKQTKGITLVALVITIIVLLILAGVTLSIVWNGGIIEKSQNAVDRYQNSAELEENMVENMAAWFDYLYQDRIASKEVGGSTVQLAIGDDVDYTTSLNGITLDDWKVFYVDGDYTYIIYGGLLPNVAVNITDIDKYGAYAVQSDYGDLLGAITDKSNWEELLSGTINGHEINRTTSEDIWAMGSPKAELWVNSWNTKYPDDLLVLVQNYTCDDWGKFDNYVYFQSAPDPGYLGANFIGKAGREDLLYFPLYDSNDDCYAYWIADYSSNEEYIMTVISNTTFWESDSAWYSTALRPVIKLPTSLLAQ